MMPEELEVLRRQARWDGFVVGCIATVAAVVFLVMVFHG